MFRPVIFSITLILLSLTRVVLSDFGDSNDLGSGSPENIYESNESENKVKIWVLELNDEGMDTLKLRRANEVDEEDFEFYTAPLIENYYREHGKVVKKDAPRPANGEVLDKKKNTTNTFVSKEDIFKYLNKFAQYSKTDSDGYLSDSHAGDDSSIALQFYDRFTCLIVKQGIRQWHYFLAPPSILPAWFYKDLPLNTSEDVITVPEDISQKFYPTLFRLLQALLRNPV